MFNRRTGHRLSHSFPIDSTLLLGALLLLCLAVPAQSQLSIFSTGDYSTPETISQIPTGTDAGDFLIPDFDRSVAGGPVWLLSSSGGAPTEFSSGDPNVALEGGLFLPSTGWGAYSGDYITDGIDRADNGGAVLAYSPDGAYTQIAGDPGTYLTTPVIAPDSFGSIGGDLVITNQLGTVETVTPTLQASTFSTLDGGALLPGGDVFAPTGFGSVGGDLLVDGLYSGTIDAISSTGAITNFADIDLGSGQTGLRQMAFSPSGFIPGYGSLLFVSISGSNAGGGTAGNVVALNSTGQIVANLELPSQFGSFDPRGLDFLDNGDLLISDASDPIDLATASDFAPVPEFSSGAIMGAFLCALFGVPLFSRLRVLLPIRQ